MINILTAVIESFNASADKADLLLKRHLRKHHVGKNDRLMLTEAFFFYLRHKQMVEYFSPDLTACSLAETALALTHDGQESLSRYNDWLTLPEEQRQQMKDSYPAYWQQEMSASFGTDKPLVMRYLNERAGVTLLNLSRRQSREALMSSLQQKSIDVKEGALSPNAVRAVGRLPKDDEAFFDVQDEGSQLTALLVNPQALQCLDYCAGSGGKSVAMGSFWPHLKLTASDIRHKLGEETVLRARRAGISLKWLSKTELKPGFDTVFVDAPCSGSGVWRRNPEDRYRMNETLHQRLIETQRALLLEAGRMVCSGGEMIYVTCSFSRQENEENIEWFLSKTKSFQLINATERFKANLLLHGVNRPTEPYYYSDVFLRNKAGWGSDLFFGAVLRKN